MIPCKELEAWKQKVTADSFDFAVDSPKMTNFHGRMIF